MDTRNRRFDIAEFIYILTTIIMLCPAEVMAQEGSLDDPLFTVGGRFHRGFIIQHTQKLKDEVTQSNPWSIEAEAIWHLRKRGVWDYCYCYPRTGISLNYTNFDLTEYQEYLGATISLKFKEGSKLAKELGEGWIVTIKEVAIPIENTIYILWGSEEKFQVLLDVILN